MLLAIVALMVTNTDTELNTARIAKSCSLVRLGISDIIVFICEIYGLAVSNCN